MRRRAPRAALGLAAAGIAWAALVGGALPPAHPTPRAVPRPPASPPPTDPRALHEYVRLARGEPWRTWEPGAESEPDTTRYDALHVDLTVAVDLVAREIRGTARWKVCLENPPPAAIVFDFFSNMEVGRACVDGAAVRWTHAGDRLDLPLEGIYQPGDTLEIEIDYRGQPQPVFLGGFAISEHDGIPLIYTNCEPTGSRTWWPCKDRPDEKFTAELCFIVPAPLVAVSNGTLVAVTAEPGNRRAYHWRERHPIAPYLVSLVATNFQRFDDTYVARDRTSMPLTHYAFPEDLDLARKAWAFTPEALAALAERFGEYPFLDEKYGMAQYPWIGAMEHQTLTSMGTYFLHLSTPQDWVVVHEMAHQWWGDWVTCGTWRDIWLNEGFATYGEALWAEQIGGPDSLHAMMDLFRFDSYPGSCYDPDFIFNRTVYRKGAWVLHMLRHVVGDSTFYAGLRHYGTRHAYASAVTADLQTAFEEIWGRPLDWFFAQWVYGEGRPLYGVWWNVAQIDDSGRAVAQVRIVQEPTVPALFTMPLDARFHLIDGTHFTAVLWDSLGDQEFWVDLPAVPRTLTLDPERWVLAEIFYDAAPSGVPQPPAGPAAELALRLLPPVPNPTAGPTRLAYRRAFFGGDGEAGSAQPRLQILDAGGRLVRILGPGAAHPAGGAFAWDGRDAHGRPVAAGVYWARLTPPSASGQARAAQRVLVVR